MIDTAKVTDRRQLRFRTMQDILDDVETIGAGGGPLEATGNWTPAQILGHVTYFIKGSLDGFDFTVPWFVRTLARLIRNRALTRPVKPGFELPANMAHTIPGPEITWDDAVGRLRACLQRIERGERMDQPSPAFGALTNEQWEQLHCRHAELHFSFIRPPAPATTPAG